MREPCYRKKVPCVEYGEMEMEMEMVVLRKTGAKQVISMGLSSPKLARYAFQRDG